MTKFGDVEITADTSIVWTWLKRGFMAFIGLLLLSILWGSWYQVDEGERAVVLNYGSFSHVSSPGLNFKIPFAQSQIPISIRTESEKYENVLTYSFDQQTAALQLTVNYTVPPGEVENIYKTYGGREQAVSRILNTKVYEAVKTVFGQFTASKAIQDRAKLNAEVNMAVKKSVAGTGLEILSVQVENIDFSDAYEQSVEARMLAEVEVQKIRQNAEKEKVNAQITVTRAQAEADSRLAEATAAAKAVELKGEADAKAIRVKGLAEAAAIKAKSDALAQSPNLVELTQAERWDGKLPAQFVPGSTIPFINVK